MWVSGLRARNQSELYAQLEGEIMRRAKEGE